MTTQEHLLIQAKPRRIEVSEYYRYHLLLAANGDTQAVEDPRGEVKIVVPFDGAEYFPRATVRFLEQRGADRTEARIGWLALSLPLDWDQDWKRPLEAEILPVHIPLQTEGMKVPDGWLSDRYRAEMRGTFDVPSPRFWPVELTLQVYDSQQASLGSLEEFLRWFQSRWYLREDKRREQPVALFWEFTVTVWVPAVLHRKEASARLEVLRLAWPSVVAPQDLSVIVLTGDETQPQSEQEGGEAADDVFGALQRWPWRYNPDQQAIEIRDMVLQADAARQRKGSPLVPYRGKIYLALHTLGPVITEDELRGDLRVRIDGLLLSGREATWLNSAGRRVKAAVVQQNTFLEATFGAYLSEQFAKRRNAIYQQWQFSGVSLEINRMAQIAAALGDLGYQIRSGVLDDGAKERRGTLRAERWARRSEDGFAHLVLEIAIEEVEQSATTYRRTVPGGLEVITEKETKDLRVHVWGQVNGSSLLLVQDLSRLLQLLSLRCQAVAEIR